MTIVESDVRANALGTVISIEVCTVWSAVPFPVLALSKHFLPAPVAVAYLLVLAAAVAWCVYRAARLGLQLGSSGIVVRNFVRTYRIEWPQIHRLADGRASEGRWALTVMLKNGSAVTALATAAKPGNPGTLTILRAAAERHGVPTDLTGVAAEPRAWLDAAQEIKLRTVRAVVCIAAAVVTLIVFIVLLPWAFRDTNPGTIELAVGTVATACVIGAIVALTSPLQLLRQPSPANYREGDWLMHGSEPDCQLGLIARTEPRHGGLVLCYVFPPAGPAQLIDDQPDELSASDAARIALVDGSSASIALSGQGGWSLIGQRSDWNRSRWPVPPFYRTDEKRGQSFKIFYDDDLRFIREEPVDLRSITELPQWPAELGLPAGTSTSPTARKAENRGWTRCAECGRTIPKAAVCARCAAPISEQAPDAPTPLGRRIARVAGVAVSGLLAAFACVMVVALFASFATQGTPAQAGVNYLPLWGTILLALFFACLAIPLVVIITQAVRRARSKHREADIARALQHAGSR